jgi:parallel beta-helix repeat protein
MKNILLIVFVSIIFIISPVNASLYQTNSNLIEDITYDLPAYFSWRDIDGIDFTTPIRNQAPFHSCETFAIVGALETMVQYQVGYPFGCDLSEAHLYFFSGGNLDWGSFPENDTNFLKEYGVPDEACWPYPSEVKQYPLNTTSPDWMNRTVKITDWYYLPEDENSIKNAIVNNGPVPTYFIVYDDFIYYKEGIYKHRWGNYRAIHYITIVGYNDNPGYWICKNSWGTGYQDEGWFNIAYGECSIEKKSFYLEGVYGNFPIIYVDDDNVNGPWDGSNENPYKTIQMGIDNAYEGWTVYVKQGIYNENIIINKTINLDGENKYSTIIDGGNYKHVITISKPNVRVSGFTIQNSGKMPFDAGIKTLSLDSNVTIKDNLIQKNGIGIFLNYAYENSWNIIQNNMIQNNIDGINVHWANNNQIFNNEISSNTDDGIEMESSRYSNIENNTIRDNGNYGLYLRAASHRNIIIKNNFIDNNIHAFFDGSIFNKWSNNYWSDSRWIFIYPIRGKLDLYDMPWIDFDINPIRTPHNLI